MRNAAHQATMINRKITVSDERTQSIRIYVSRCPVDWKDHDWRYASNAPGWLIGDDCARCQKCQQLGIKPLEAKHE